MTAIPDSHAPEQRSWYKRNEIAITPWLFLLPAMLFFAVYVIIPIGQSFWISFHQWDGLGEKTWVGMGNYERLLGLGERWWLVWSFPGSTCPQMVPLIRSSRSLG